MKPLRCLLVDDERLARLELSALLEEEGSCAVVGEAANAEQALELIPKLQPDVIFLDINMPGTNGFELLSQLEHCPPVVFVTAYDQYAIKAFEVHALDYLLKPVRPDRLSATIQRLRSLDITDVPERLFLTNRSGGRFVNLSDIFLVRAYDHHVRLYHGRGSDMLHQSLKHFREQLRDHDFFVVNRSEIVRVSAVIAVEKLSRGRYRLILPDGERADVSERQSVEWRRRFGR